MDDSRDTGLAPFSQFIFISRQCLQQLCWKTSPHCDSHIWTSKPNECTSQMNIPGVLCLNYKENSIKGREKSCSMACSRARQCNWCNNGRSDLLKMTGQNVLVVCENNIKRLLFWPKWKKGTDLKIQNKCCFCPVQNRLQGILFCLPIYLQWETYDTNSLTVKFSPSLSGSQETSETKEGCPDFCKHASCHPSTETARVQRKC